MQWSPQGNTWYLGSDFTEMGGQKALILIYAETTPKVNLFPITFNVVFDLPIPEVAKATIIFHPQMTRLDL